MISFLFNLINYLCISVYVSVQSGDGESDIILGDGNLHDGNAISHHRASEMSLTEQDHHIIIQVSDADAEQDKGLILSF